MQLVNQDGKTYISFILIGTGNPELGTEYDSISVSDPSRSENFLPAVRSLYPRLFTKSEPTFNFISPDTTPQP